MRERKTMKTILTITLCVLFSCLALAQNQVATITPVIQSTKLDSILTVSGSAKVVSKSHITTPFTSLVAGQSVYGKGVPYGTTVVSVVTTKDTATLSANLTESAALASLNFGYFTST